MWLKKLFKKDSDDKSKDLGQVQHDAKLHLSLEEDPEGNQSKIFTVPEKQLDLRYSLLPIVSVHNLNLPKQQINLIEFALFQDIDSFHSKSKYADEWIKTIVIVTDKQILLNPDPLRFGGNSIHQHNILHICYGRLEKIEYNEGKKDPMLCLTLKDSRQLAIKSDKKDKLKEVQKLVAQFGFPKGINEFFAFKYGKVNKKFNGWSIFNFEKEMQRQGVTAFLKKQGQQQDKAYQLINNAAFELSPTYPVNLIVPSGMSEKDIMKCANFRTKQRLPILTYFYQWQPKSYVSLFRCSQNKGGLLDLRSSEDQKMIKCIHNATKQISEKFAENKNRLNCKIYDARGYYAALGNKIAGKGFENEQFYNCQVEFLDIPNIHAVRDSYNRVKNYNPFKQDFIQVYGQSGWLDVLYLILTGAKSMSKCLLNGKNVIVHCSDGWDRTTQLSCLSQIIIQPYYRTLQGFIVLFEKDWRQCGHKFRQRSGQYNHRDYHVKEISPIFIQYLDCILQIMNQFTLSFEFNINLLNFLASAYQSYVYGTFMTNNVRESIMIDLQNKTISVWSDVLERREQFINVLYRADGPKILEIDVSGMDFRIWREHFLQTKTLKLKQYQHYYRQVQINRELKQQIARLDEQLSQLHGKFVEAQVKNVQLELKLE